MQRLDDVLVEVLEALILGRALFERAIQAGVLESDGEVARYRFHQREIFGRQILPRLVQPQTNPGDRAALHPARHVIVKVEFGDRFVLRRRIQRLVAGVAERSIAQPLH